MSGVNATPVRVLTSMAPTGDEGGEAPVVPQTLLRPPAVHRTHPVRWTAQTGQEKTDG